MHGTTVKKKMKQKRNYSTDLESVRLVGLCYLIHIDLFVIFHYPDASNLKQLSFFNRTTFSLNPATSRRKRNMNLSELLRANQ